VSGFSPDGEWWWDGNQWIRTLDIKLTPETEFERSGKLKKARRLMASEDWIFIAIYLAGITILGIPVIVPLLIAYEVVLYRAFGLYRQWSLEVLGLATVELFNPPEPMVAGETTLWPNGVLWPSTRRDYAVAVTKAHVVMYRFDHYDSPIARVVFVARSADVEMLKLQGVLRTSIAVTHSGQRWFLPGLRWVYQAEPVLEAWRKGRQ
jgi:hypothetical protein